MDSSRPQTPSHAGNSSISEPVTPFTSSSDFEQVLLTPNSPLDTTKSGLWSPTLSLETATKKLQRNNATLKRDLDEANDHIDFLERRVTRAQMAQKQENQQRLEAEEALKAWEVQLRFGNENSSKRIQLLQEEKEMLKGELEGLKVTILSQSRELRVQRIVAGAAFELSEDLQEMTTLQRLETLVRSGEYQRIIAAPAEVKLLESGPLRANDLSARGTPDETVRNTVNTTDMIEKRQEALLSPKKRICIHEDDDCRVEEDVDEKPGGETDIGKAGNRKRRLRRSGNVNYDIDSYYCDMAL